MAVITTPPPPTDNGAEMALVGDILRNPSTLAKVGYLESEQFWDPLLGRLFDSLKTRIVTGLPSDLLALAADFEISGALEEVGGTGFLSQLADLPPLADVSATAARLQDLWQRRALIPVFEQLHSEIEEWWLDAQASTTRASGQQLGKTASVRLTEMFAILSTILVPIPATLALRINDLARAVVLANSEIAELADYHVAKSAEEREAGNFFYESRLMRAEQLRALLSQVQP